MQPSAITDFRLGLERRLPQASLDARTPQAAEWSGTIAIGDRRHVVSWSQTDGFVIAGRRIRNVDTALDAVASLFAPLRLAA